MGDLTQLAGEMRRRNNNMLSTLYTQIEAVLGETKQCKALKDLVKWEVWRCTDDKEDYMYRLFRGELDTNPLALPDES